MARSTRENAARAKVYKLMPPRQIGGPFWWQSMSGTGTGGTPDHYYEGPIGTLWVEWKWTTSRYPRTTPTPESLQETWLRRKFENGGKVAVIQASPVGYRIYPGLSWEGSHVISPSTKLEAAEYIYGVTAGALP